MRVEVHHPLPLCHRQLLCGGTRVRDRRRAADTVEEDVDLAKAVGDVRDDGVHLPRLEGIGGIGVVRAATCRCERFHRAVELLAIVVNGGDGAALGRDHLGAGTADATGGRRHQCDLAFEARE